MSEWIDWEKPVNLTKEIFDEYAVPVILKEVSINQVLIIWRLHDLDKFFAAMVDWEGKLIGTTHTGTLQAGIQFVENVPEPRYAVLIWDKNGCKVDSSWPDIHSANDRENDLIMESEGEIYTSIVEHPNED